MVKRVLSSLGKNGLVPFWVPVIVQLYVEHGVLWAQKTFLGHFSGHYPAHSTLIDHEMV